MRQVVLKSKQVQMEATVAGLPSSSSAVRGRRAGLLKGLGAAAIFGCMIVSASWAQSFPSRPLRLIIGQPPGGLPDLAGRIYAKELEQRLKQPMIVENRPGASGLIGARAVATAPPDGFTLHLSTGVNQSRMLMKNGLDLDNELAPVSILFSGPWVLMSRASLPVTSFAELVTHAKSKQVNFASPGVLNSLAMGVIEARTGLDYLNVNYKGSVPIVQALLTGEVDITMTTSPPFVPTLQSGKLRALFVTGKSAALPGVPTAEEVGLGNFRGGYNLGIWVPVGTPKDIVARLSSEFAAVTALPRVQEAIRNTLGGEPVGSTTEEMRRVVDAELRFWGEAVRNAKYVPE